ncbi:MAG TPA: gamma-glutamyl-gamma-aminobutyrate hydrolase family protein [Solirubrobacteraceae bacterium]|nr:gamma-glutamyl-gamma-aminobutyrate hydrolase family protein [Solirubrobacteraceae bacterium]
MSRPRIAITPWLRELPTPLGERTRLYALDPAYAAGVAAAGGVPLVVPRDADPDEALAGMDGLLLSGGGDVAPATYGAVDEGGCEDVDPATDAWELALIARAREQRLPTVGICRGMQLLAIAHGGGLAQRCDPALHPGMGALPPAESLARRHPVQLAAGSAAARVFGVARVAVNTLHHQVVRDAGELVVSGRAGDGTIEALEAADWPALGVQWHPEKMPEPEQARLFRFLVAPLSAVA